MQVNRISYQPNFQARFIKSPTLMETTKLEILNSEDGGDKWVTELGRLSRHHKDAELLMEYIPECKKGNVPYPPTYIISNLTTGKTISKENEPFNARDLAVLNNPRSDAYQQLFYKPDINETLKNISDKYYDKHDTFYPSSK